jgi:protein TonB
VLPPRFDAAYLNNPKPSYPPLARRLGEEGRVTLRVHVTPDGLPQKHVSSLITLYEATSL